MGNEKYCMLCFKPLQIGDARGGANEHYKKLIKCCEKFLPEELTNELTSWTFCDGASLPVCVVCYSSSQKLYRMNTQLESIYKNLEESINTFSTEIACCRLLYISETHNVPKLTAQNVPDLPSSETQSANSALTVEVKEEQERVCEVDVLDDNGCFFDFESDPYPNEETENSVMQTEDKLNTSYAKIEVKPSNVRFDFTDGFPKQLRVSLERLRFNSKGIIIPSRAATKRKRPSQGTGRRKAAIRAIKSIRNQKSEFKEEFVEELILGDFKRRKTHNDDSWTDNNMSAAEGSMGEDSDSGDQENSLSTRKESILYYTCSVCNEEFSNATSLDMHSANENHINIKKVGCTRCHKTFYKVGDCKRHFRNHQIPSRACPMCGMTFTSWHAYKYHTIKHRGSNCNQCSICKVKWASMSALFGHYITEHSDVPPLKCEECDRLYYTEETLKKHKLVHERKEGDDPPVREPDHVIQWTYETLEEIKEKMLPPIPLLKMEIGFKCNVCEMHFDLTKDLETHSEQTGHVNEKKAACRTCDRIFYRHRDVYDHKRRCRGLFSDATPFPVQPNTENCWKVVDSDTIMLQETIERKKIAWKRARLFFTCSVCDMVFTLGKHLDAHSAETGHVNERKFCCPKCPSKYYRGKDLKDHRRKHVREEKMKQQKGDDGNKNDDEEDSDNEDVNKKANSLSYQCSECKCQFRLAIHLEAHLQQAGHVTEKTIQCTEAECARMFYRGRDMRKHAKDHSFVPKDCTSCGQTFTRPGPYKKHVYEHKLGKFQSTIRCTLCKAIYATIKHLKDHMNSEHFNVPPLNCENCDRQYYSAEKFDEHVKVHLDCISKNIPFEEPQGEWEWTWQNIEKYKNDVLPPTMEKATKGFVCLVCGQWFEWAKSLDQHSESAGHVNEKNVHCGACDRTFYRNRDLWSHTRQSQLCNQFLKDLQLSGVPKELAEPETSSKPSS